MTRFRPLLATLAIAALAVACDGRPRVATDPSMARPHTGPALVVLDLSHGVPETVSPSLLQVVHRGTFDELVEAMDHLGADKGVRGVFVRFGDTSFGLARATEIGQALEAVRKGGKPVFCHAEGLSNATYYAAARGCSKIFLSPAGEIETIGIAAQILYGHKLLAEELHLSVDILQVGKFKGAEEPLTRDGPSDEARASLQSVLVDLRQAWIEGIVGARKDRDTAGAIEDGPYAAKRAREAGLVDEVAYADDARDAARKEAGAVRDDVRFGASSDADRSDDLGDLVRLLAGQNAPGAPIALLRATGSITMSRGSGGLVGGSGGITAHDMERTLSRLEHDDDVRAVVLRIDSPGGSALASDLIWHRLMKLREKKPVVVSVGEMAASGGYYLASTASFIYAEPASIVGSIGVVGGKIAVNQALDKIGVHTETFPANTANPRAAARAAYPSMLMEWDDATRERVLESMTGTYELFLARVAEGRKTTVDKIAPSAEGRIFSGREGKARGLVDELGGLEAAIVKARELAKLPADAGVAAIEPYRNVLEQLGAPGAADEGGEEGRASVGRGPAAMNAIAEVAPEVVPFAESLAPLLAGERTLTTVPFGLVVR